MGGGGSIFWKTREIGLPSYNDLSTVAGKQTTMEAGNEKVDAKRPNKESGPYQNDQLSEPI
jgi:hypothetical protein